MSEKAPAKPLFCRLARACASSSQSTELTSCRRSLSFPYTQTGLRVYFAGRAASAPSSARPQQAALIVYYRQCPARA